MAATRPATPKPPRDSAAPDDAERRAQLFASVMANAKDAVLVTEAEPVDRASGGPRILYVNEAFTAMTGYSRDEAVGATPRMLQSPRTDQRELDRLRTALRRWEPVEVELLNVHKDGSEFWVQFIIVPVADAAGWFTHWVSIQRDITARRQRDAELAALIADATDLVALVDSQGRIRAASPAAERALTSGDDSLVGTPIVECLALEHRAAAGAAVKSAGRLGAVAGPWELELGTTAGRRWFEISLRPVATDADDAGVVITAVDATERRSAEVALREAQRRFAGAFADAPIGMAVVGRDGYLLETNAQLCRLLGRDEATLLASRLTDLVHPSDRDASEAEHGEVFDGKLAVGRRETRLLHTDGRVVGVMLSSSVARRDDEVVELVVHVEDISERKALEARLTHQALHDTLTQLPNRALFVDRLQIALRRGEREKAPVSVLFLDLDRFKIVNDELGHEVGDRLLTTVAKRLGALVRPGDTAARFGGDEFTILCEGASAEEATIVAERIAEALEAPILLEPHGQVHVRASIGIATAYVAGATPDTLLRDADTAMYAAKKAVDARYEVFDERLRARASARKEDEEELIRAVEDDELELVYQPLFDAGSDSGVLEFEALVRWRHRERGLLSPATFIPLAEDSGLIVAVDRWVLSRACMETARTDFGSARVWVNVSQQTLDDPDLADVVQACLAESGLPAGALGIEITERDVVEGSEVVSATIARLRHLGVDLAADDFGTGYSSLSALIERPVDVLKIDRSFISELPGPTGEALIRAIVAMADALGLRTVAEGVERPDQLEAVRRLGCDLVQGYLLARPMTLTALTEHYEIGAPAPA